MSAEESSHEQMSLGSEPPEKEPLGEIDEEEATPKLTLRAERSGIGSLLSSLRGDHLAAEIRRLSTSPTSEKEEDQEEVPERPLNRKEKRRLQRLQEEQNPGVEVKKKVPEVLEPADLPKELRQLFSDTKSFDFYEASFGYEVTRRNNFVHFVLQSYQGTRAIAASQDRVLRMYSMENYGVLWKKNTGALILDSCWESSGRGVFSSSFRRPIQLFDADSGDIIRSYSGKDAGDNIKEAMCVGNMGNNILIGGYKNHFQVWDVETSGDAFSRISYMDKSFNTGITGVALSIAAHPTMPDLFGTAGSSHLLGIYSINWANAVSTMEGSLKGYTNVHFSPDGLKMYASERSGDIHCFDTRMNMMTQILKRDFVTAHRSRFDIDATGRLLISGTSSGDVVVYDLHDFREEIEPVFTCHVASRCVPCVSLRGNRIALCTGQRVFPDDPLLKEDDDSGDVEMMDTLATGNSVQTWEML
ncbi:hypothetical protein B9Z55_003928 [Caenorhabditis nigoni]|uniref:Anaphase-promoting complex subunit 4 WD40 domain-containing protein n=2 Tax=Caenorhabditis nigoni TaxID=1611254 RepID=A0A2G5VT36_9PELO|nr:hypothetical protein B9Z55_003928 [Caenorhabditis nigoni]